LFQLVVAIAVILLLQAADGKSMLWPRSSVRADWWVEQTVRLCAGDLRGEVVHHAPGFTPDFDRLCYLAAL
jgi:hypothetical protein